MTRNELIWKIDHGDDIMFDVSGKGYVIFTWPDDGIRIGEQNSDDGDMTFQTSEDLIDNFSIKGVPLADLIDKIVITSYTLVRDDEDATVF